MLNEMQMPDHGQRNRERLRLEPAGYEQAVVMQARRIAAGQSRETPNVEHLRVLLQWLDGSGTVASEYMTNSH